MLKTNAYAATSATTALAPFSIDRREPVPCLIQVLPIGRRRVSSGIDKQLPEAGQGLSDEHLSLLDELDQWTTVPLAGRILESRLATYVHRVCPVVPIGQRGSASSWV